MAERSSRDPVFATVAMAEIFLSQNLVDQARRVVDQLTARDPAHPRLVSLRARIAEIASRSGAEPLAVPARGVDSIALVEQDGAVRVTYELTDGGLELAQRKARYSGRSVLRLFTAAPGPRGVRTTSRDIDLDKLAARFELHGLPRPAVLVAAVGFLANTGEYIPLARSSVLCIGPV